MLNFFDRVKEDSRKSVAHISFEPSRFESITSVVIIIKNTDETFQELYFIWLSKNIHVNDDFQKDIPMRFIL